jgi:hypothetical protein
MATITASSVSSSDSVEKFRQEFNTLRSDVSNINSAAITISNEANNRILTSVSTNTLNAEESLTFDGSTFSVGGAMTVSGLTTLNGNLVIPNAGNIGSTGDTDAIAIASDGTVTFSSDVTLTGDSANAVWDKSANALEFADNAKAIFGTGSDLQIYHDGTNSIISGVVTFSQSPVFPDGSIAVADLDIDGATDIGAAITDADLIIVDDGAGGTNRKATMSRLKTYMGLSAGALALTSLDIDGGTDIGAAIADADLFIVDDGAGGTNRKTAASRIKTYIADVTLTTAAQTNITSVGTLTTLTVDNIIINGTNIGHTSDTDAIAIASDGTVTFSSDVTFTGASYNAVWDASANALEFADNAKAVFGAGDDLGIYHDGSNSYIKDSGTGDLKLQGNNFTIGNTADTKYFTATNGGGVEIYHQGNEKLGTTSGGINVTGTVTSDGADLDGAVVINESSADVDFRVESNGNQNMLFVDGGNDRVGIGTNAPGTALHVSASSPRISLTDTDTGADHYINADSSAGNLSFDIDINSETTSPAAVWNLKGTERMRLTTAGSLGIGSNSPSGDLHVKSGAASAATPSSEAHELVLEAGGNGGLTIATPNATGISSIFFANADSSAAGRIRYYNQHDLMNFSVDTSEVLRFETSTTVFNEGSADRDFRVESNNNANMLFVDAGNDRVGIGTNAPGQPLEIFSNTAEVSLNSSSSTYSRFVHKHNGTAMWTTGTRGDGDYHIYRESGSGNVVIGSGGSLNVGGNDTGSAGLINVYGGSTGEGGEIRIYTSAAEDTTIEHWNIDVATDDLRIFSNLGDLAIVAAANGATSLYHDGSSKLSTTSGGVSVSGTVTATAGATLLIVNSSGTTLKTIKGMS